VFLVALQLLQLPAMTQDLRIDGDFQGSSLKEVLKLIEDQYPLRFFYLDQWLPNQTISHHFEQQLLDEVMSVLLQGSDLSYLIYSSDKVIIGKKDQMDDLISDEYFRTRQALSAAEVDSRFPVLTIGDSTGTSNATLHDIVLHFTDKDEGQHLTEVQVYFDKLQRTVNSDQNGRIALTLPHGIYQIEARRVGYNPLLANLAVVSTGNLNITMEQEAIELMEVVVSGEGPDQRLLNPSAGLVTLTPKQIKEMPVFLGEADVIKTIQTLPGVITIGEGTAGFFVRGGNIDQNLIMQDGAILSNASHALGFFSIFNPDLISQAQLFKGHIPAQYGGRLSSVLDVQLKGNDYTNTTMSGGIGTVISKVALETPVVKEKVSLLAGGRISYADWLLPVVKIPEIKESEAFFYDFNVKLSAKISDRGTVSAGYFQSFDQVDFQGEAGFEWSVKNASLAWTQDIGETLESDFEASMGTTNNLNFDPSGLSITQLENGLDFFKLKENLSLSWKDHQTIIGGEWIYYQPQDERLTATGSQNIEEQVSRDAGKELGLYISDAWNVSDNLAISVGLRTSLFTVEEHEENTQSTSYTNFEPRVSFRYTLANSSALKASYHRMSQYVHLLSNTTGVLPVDQWVTSNSTIKPSISNNISIGYFRNFTDDTWESSIEVFYRQMDDLIEFRDFADLVLNDQIEDEIIQGEGKAHGVELFLKRNKGRLKGNLSYTFSRTFIKVPLDAQESEPDWIPTRFDRPHVVNLVLDWTVNRRSRFGLVFNYASGRPITAPVSTYNLGSVVVPHYGDRNDYRIPNYHRLDLTYTYKRNAVKTKRYQDSITFSLYNVYGRRNAFSVFFRKENNQPAKAFQLSVLGSIFPSITYTFEFR
jgi:outer membrane receptor for ferrienterochelin and colicin